MLLLLLPLLCTTATTDVADSTTIFASVPAAVAVPAIFAATIIASVPAAVTASLILATTNVLSVPAAFAVSLVAIVPAAFFDAVAAATAVANTIFGLGFYGIFNVNLRLT